MKVVCIDDEELLLNFLVRKLKQVEGIDEIHPFTSSVEALEYISNNKVDILLSDIYMPEINGINLAKKVKKISPNIAIIFITSYEEYALDALKLHACGYILKPVNLADLKREIANAVKTMGIKDSKQLLRVQCFGSFEVFYDEKPVVFKRSKTKELFAYLVDRKGARSNVNELCAVLWEDKADSDSLKSYFRILFADLRTTFKKLGLEDVIIKGANSYAVDINAFTCDAYDYEKGDEIAINKYRGEYMSQYSWAIFEEDYL